MVAKSAVAYVGHPHKGETRGTSQMLEEFSKHFKIHFFLASGYGNGTGWQSPLISGYASLRVASLPLLLLLRPYLHFSIGFRLGGCLRCPVGSHAPVILFLLFLFVREQRRRTRDQLRGSAEIELGEIRQGGSSIYWRSFKL